MRAVGNAVRILALTTVAALTIAIGSAPVGAAGSGSTTPGPITGRTGHLRKAKPTSRRTPFDQLTPAQQEAVEGSLLVGDPDAYAKAKQHADRAAAARRAAASATSGPHAASGSRAPTAQQNFTGVFDPNFTPSDSTGSIGTSRYVEMVNSKVGIFDRTNHSTIATSDLNTFTAAGTGPSVFDPQVIWDPGTNRFYYAADIVVSSTDNRLAFGFSTTASPSNATTDWCKYNVGYNAEFPDYPKLGDLSGLVMIGVNVFGTVAFIRSDVVGITKPAAGTTCPAPTSFTLSFAQNLLNADASKSTTPVPVNQTDDDTTGFVLTGKGFTGGNFISVFNATKNASNQIVLAAARAMTVPAFSVPASAPQPGTARTLDTLDTRLTQAVSAIDPGHSNKVGIWTQHTVAGGAGAQVRWYEIDPSPATPTPFQSGTQTSASLFLFNAAISPDRRRNGATGQFGDTMVLHYNKSSSSQFVNIVAVNKIATSAVSGETVLQTSSSIIDDFACGRNAPNLCRWGDYAGASPDPASDTTKAHGVVWGTSAWALAASGTSADWQTQNFAVQPK